jgi:dienelactone hydrolase
VKQSSALLTLLLLLHVASSPGQESQPAGTHELTVYEVRPSQTDPRIQQFDDPHRIVFNPSTSATAQLAVFLPGTHGKPGNARALLQVIATEGYRAIGLEYNDSPAVDQVCPRDPRPTCAAQFRHTRIFGSADNGPVTNIDAESIVSRLTGLLIYLDNQHPHEQWHQYLLPDGPDWSRIVVCGLSQGAGMAAYIAKLKPVARVVLFSGPWDYFGRARSLAPWLEAPSVTPPERWFASYHRREKAASMIASSYAALGIPRTHIRVLDLDIPPQFRSEHSDNPNHATTIRIPAYEPEWRLLLGHSP